MNTKVYDVFLDDKIIGTTKFEKSDPPMGVIFGLLTFIDIVYGYDFIKNYCTENAIQLVHDYPTNKLLSTGTISNLKVLNENGIEVKGGENQISGMDGEFEITLLGVSYPFFEEEFPHHVKTYNEQFNK
ncbi:hypothetical protein H8B06_19000 [Sphingobacterium sp. DN00404]|uniref:Uncharacterized protein n=1 Tax=Sphingobacterium micropteri TaxID=2763501 RepID=A0ABR7YU90_9SPHI|nr:hypothetical protein [Sphingobacterium micropteri]MBD1434917.1 hypothetical protein [Sphingobacterium micropteri]